MATQLYQEERKTPAGAGDGRDLAAPNPERSCLIYVMKHKWKPKSVRERRDIFEVEGDRECLESFLRGWRICRSERHGEIADERSTVRLVVQGVQPCWCAWLGTFPLAVLAGWCKDKQ